MKFSPAVFLFSMVSSTVVVTIADAGDFAQFRGSLGNGVAESQPIATAWSADTNVAWKVRNPGAGWSQPIVWGDHLYVTGAVAEKDIRPANFADGLKSPQSMGVSMFAKAPDVDMQWKLFCLSVRDGSTIWEQTVAQGKPRHPIHPSNSWATETPVTDADGVYVSFGAAGIVAGLGHDGTLKWKNDLGVFKTSNGFGTGSSLAIYQGRVFAQNFTEESALVVSFDTITGQEKWKTTRPQNGTSWSTPVLWKNEKRVELIVSGGEEVDSYDPESGERLWILKNVKAATACSPCCDVRHLYFGGSDPFSKGPLFAVRAGGTGDISPKKKNDKFAVCEWLQDRQGPGMASPVSSGKHVYSTDNNILKCFDAGTGQRLYQSRLPGLDMVAACPILVGDQLLVIDENGNSCLVASGPEFSVIGQGSVGDTVWATPAVSNGALFIRGLKNIYCIRAN